VGGVLAVRRPATARENNAMTGARISLTQLGYISEAVSRFRSVFGSKFSRGVLRSEFTE
jgi:hypothetical protein